MLLFWLHILYLTYSKDKFFLRKKHTIHNGKETMVYFSSEMLPFCDTSKWGGVLLKVLFLLTEDWQVSVSRHNSA